jgi:hypothetical protein
MVTLETNSRGATNGPGSIASVGILRFCLYLTAVSAKVYDLSLGGVVKVLLPSSSRRFCCFYAGLMSSSQIGNLRAAIPFDLRQGSLGCIDSRCLPCPGEAHNSCPNGSLRDPCRPKAAGGLELVGLAAQGNVILAGSTFRREKMRLDPCTGPSITAQSRCSSTSLPPLMAHRRPALPRLRGCLTEKSLVKIGEPSHTRTREEICLWQRGVFAKRVIIWIFGGKHRGLECISILPVRLG